jgi:hypothetical protein
MYITQKRLLKWALYGLSIYIFLYLIFRPEGINIQKIVITILMLFSLLTTIFIGIKNSKQLKSISKFPRFLFYLIIFWGCITIIRGFSLSIQDWVTNFGNVYMAAAWLSPVALILGLKIENWSVVFKAIFFMFQLMFFLFFASLFYNVDYNDWVMLLRPVNLILLIGLYHFRFNDKIKTYLLIIIYIIVNAYFSSRRVDLLFLFLTVSLLLMDKLLVIRVRKKFLKYILFGFLSGVIIIFTFGYELVSIFIASFIDFQDSRTFLFKELMSDLNFTEKIFGRGSLGTYFSEFMEHTKRYTEEILKQKWWGDASVRITTEVGYLQMILKGGFILLSLNLFMSVYAIYLAIFKSNNRLITRLGYYILVISVLSIVEFRPTFTPAFIIFWMAIGTVLKKEYRQMNDSEIESLIKFK